LTAGGIPVASFSFKGLYATPTATSNATPTLTSFKKPQVVSEANTADLTFGGTHASPPARRRSRAARPTRRWASSSTSTTPWSTRPCSAARRSNSRSATRPAALQLELTAAQEVTFMGYVEGATTQSVGIIHGTAAGYKSLLWLPTVQLINPQKQELVGKRTVQFEGRVVPTSGNDEARLVLF
jgi:hypothetical protein